MDGKRRRSSPPHTFSIRTVWHKRPLLLQHWGRSHVFLYQWTLKKSNLTLDIHEVETWFLHPPPSSLDDLQCSLDLTCGAIVFSRPRYCADFLSCRANSGDNMKSLWKLIRRKWLNSPILKVSNANPWHTSHLITLLGGHWKTALLLIFKNYLMFKHS